MVPYKLKLLLPVLRGFPFKDLGAVLYFFVGLLVAWLFWIFDTTSIDCVCCFSYNQHCLLTCAFDLLLESSLLDVILDLIEDCMLLLLNFP